MLRHKTQDHSLKLKTFKIFIFTLWFCALNFALYASSFAEEQFVYDAKGRRDPFIPLVTPDGRLLKLDKEEGEKDLSIEGIIYDKHGRSFVIVNGSVVGIGDTVDDYQVLEIEENKVTFIKDGQAQEVELKKEEE